MTMNELQSMTVLQLRKVAKEYGVVLGAGIDKAGIVAKIYAAAGDDGAPAAKEPVQASFFEDEPQASIPVEAPVEKPAAEKPRRGRPPRNPEKAAAKPAASKPAAEKPTEKPAAQPAQEPHPAEPRFQAAWHSAPAPTPQPSQPPRFSGKPAYQSGYSNHPAWQNTTPSGRQMTPEQRVQPTRPGTGAPRFGPAAHPVAEAPAEPLRPAMSPLPERRMGFAGDSGFAGRQAAAYTSTISSGPDQPEAVVSVLPNEAQAVAAPTLEELLASGDYEQGGGILELHPDGYGFLRASNFLPSSRDVYVSMAQIRRFGLRTGDLVQGKIRPQREGDKFSALLYIDSINGVPAEEIVSRPIFDELTPVYPSRRISLESKDGKSWPDMRLIDLIAPIGFGQRALLLCPPDTGKITLMQHMATVIQSNYPEVSMMMLLIDVNPEDVTMVRDAVSCPVLASTFDQAPEAHLRLSEIVLERAMREVEQGKDVVLLADSLTRLAKVYTTAAAQQGRSLPGMINPASLFRAKRLFGAARACKEGGSLTVIAAMDIATGSKVDDSVVEEFKGTANMELTLDQIVARNGVSPALSLQHSFTKNADILLDQRQKEGLSLIRTMLGSTSSSVAIPQLLSMMDKAPTNQQLLLKMKDWFALMNR